MSVPNFDASDSDIVRLEWKHSEFLESASKSDDITKEGEFISPDSQKDEQVPDESKEELHPLEPQEITPTVNEQLSDDKEKSEMSAESRMATEQEVHLLGTEESAGTDVDAAAIEQQNEKSKITELGSSDQVSEQNGFYTVIITGLHVKKPKKQDKFTIENLESKDEAFKMSESVYVNPDSQTQLAKYEFSLKHLLERYIHQLQDGLTFQCQVFSNGISKLHSTPKLFPEFVLLAPPTKMKVTASEKQAGLRIDWEHCLHAVGYRLELVAQQDKSVVSSKTLKSGGGRKGKILLFKNELKDIPFTTCSEKGYQLQMYSLGFGQELIRCLKPSIASGVLHVIPAELQYLSDSNAIQVQFKPHAMERDGYVVELYRLTTTDNTSKARHLTTSAKHHQKVRNKTAVVDIPLKNCQYLLHSGDLIVAWVYSVKPGITCVGMPKEEVLVLDSPKFIETSLVYEYSGTVRGLRLVWSDIPGTCGYQYGFYLTDTKEHVSLMEIQETEVTIYFSSSFLEKVECGGFCQFQVYVTALGKPGVQVVGALSLDVHLFQCITNASGERSSPIVFTPIMLQHVWTRYLLSNAAYNYYSLTSNPRHFLFPYGERFPDLCIPKKMRERFWQLVMEDQLFGDHGMYNIEIMV